MNDILQSVVTAAKAMSPLEIVANITFAASVILCNFRSWKNYPLGIIGTICFFFVFWHAKLYNLAILQVWLTAVQAYGWWFWLYGKKGSPPPITRVSLLWWMGGLIFTTIAGLTLATVSAHLGGAMAIPDALLFALSVVAQFFLDRKKLENWIVWFIINTISIPLFWSQGLYLTAIIYSFFWGNAIVAFFMWLKEYRSYVNPPVGTAVAVTKYGV